MFNWSKWKKSLASLVMLVGVGVVIYGDFSIGQGVTPDTDFKGLHTGEEVVVKEVEKKKQQEQQVATATSQSNQGQTNTEKPKQEQQAPQERRTDGFNFHNYHFPVKSWSGSGGQKVPMETNNVYQWASKPTHYLVEINSSAGRVIQQLGMGDTVELNGKSYVVTHIKRKVPNDNKAMEVLNSESADITIQTSETTRGANGEWDVTLWYLHAQ